MNVHYIVTFFNESSRKFNDFFYYVFLGGRVSDYNQNIQKNADKVKLYFILKNHFAAL